jgi:outer membrane protein assembly factor BamB
LERKPVRPLVLGLTVALWMVFFLADRGFSFDGVLAGSPWPMYRHDPSHMGFNGARGPRKGLIKWVFSTGRAEKFGGFENDVTIGPDGTLYIGANNGILYGLDPEDGSIRWVHISAFDTFGIYSTAAVDRQGLIYYGAKDGYLYVLRPPKRGIAMEVVWKFFLGTTIETSPVLSRDGTVYIGADDWKLYAIAPPEAGSTVGRLKWTFQTGGTLISSPALDLQGTIYIGSMDGNLYALVDEGPGRPPRLKWTFSTGKKGPEGGIETSPVVAGDLVLIGGNDGVLYGLDRSSGKPRWRLKTWYDTYGIFSNPAVDQDGRFYFGPKDGRLLAITAEGKIVWSYTIGTTIETSPAIGADGVVYIGADDGKLYAVEPPSAWWERKPKLLWSFQTRGTLIGSPVLDEDGTLYQPSMDGRLYAFHDTKRARRSRQGLTGTWYGLVQPEVGSKASATAVVRDREGFVEVAWRVGHAAFGTAHGRIKDGILELRGGIERAGCQDILEVSARLDASRVEGTYRLSACPGLKPQKGTLFLRR